MQNTQCQVLNMGVIFIKYYAYCSRHRISPGTFIKFPFPKKYSAAQLTIRNYASPRPGCFRAPLFLNQPGGAGGTRTRVLGVLVLGEAWQPGPWPEPRPQAPGTHGAATAQRLPRVVTARAGHPCATVQPSRTLRPRLGQGGAHGVDSPRTRGTVICESGKGGDPGFQRQSERPATEL